MSHCDEEVLALLALGELGNNDAGLITDVQVAAKALFFKALAAKAYEAACPDAGVVAQQGLASREWFNHRLRL